MTLSADTTGLKEAARARIEESRGELLRISHGIHANPELSFAEHYAAETLASAVEAAGYRVSRGAFGLETAFDATAGTGRTTVAICAEYDALPQIGHACGHNIIAAAALGAWLGLAHVCDDANLTVRLIGTPAEEAGNRSGKMIQLERGAFEGVDAAMMVHPGPVDLSEPNMIAAALMDIEYQGKESHAASHPELGVNAADAMVVAQVGIGLLRQHLLTTDRVHGIVTHGGDAPNIIPAHTRGRFMVRADRLERVGVVRERVLGCFDAGARATGSLLTVTGGDQPYAHVVHNERLAGLYRRNAEAIGRRFDDGEAARRPFGSTDMGNVSLRVPTIHPFIGIRSLPAVNHQPEFAAHCVGPDADRAVIDAALAMAHTAIDLGCQVDVTSFLSGDGASTLHESRRETPKNG